MLPTPSSFRPESLVGTTLDGRYRLAAHIASGGMGSIFRAEHVYMRKELALKVLRPDLSTLPDIAERFRREAEIAASLEHDHIVRVTDFGRSPEGWLFLAMELLEGESLFDRLRRAGPMMPEEAIRILVQVCSGLEAAHARGVVHRDLKPENIFLTAGADGVVKLLDFGIAKITDPGVASDTQAGMVVGTPEYLSPEQALGSAIDGRADVYAVGLIGWRMLAGHHPFQAEDARGLLMMQATRPVPSLLDVRPDLGAWPALLDALARACAKEADARPPASDLRATLEACVGALAPPRPASPSRGRTRSWNGAAAAAPPLPAVTAPAVSGGSVGQADEATLTLDPSAPTPLAPSIPSLGPPVEPEVRGNRLVAWARSRWAMLALAAIAVAAVPASLAVNRWLEERPVVRAREHLAARRWEAARDAIAPAVLRRPADPRLRVMQARALHRIPGQASAALDAYAAAFDLDPRTLDGPAYADVAQDLSQDRKLAERAAHLLARAGAPAVPAVVAAAQSGPGVARLRALDLAREMGAEERLDRVAAYVALLGDDDCDVRRAAARRLGDLGARAALPRLRELAAQTRSIRGLLGLPQSVPACAAAEAEAAIRRIEPAERARAARGGAR
ncbi:MAG TPA: serine/threonine-protein kinase [Anaeromyxobacteraceae bacterium]|nr:serine/threonine-protein kinase [Anaeromyxobacteraceae bacterium]